METPDALKVAVPPGPFQAEITKVYFKGGWLKLEWLELQDKRSLETQTPPHPDLIEAFKNLRPDFLALCELPATEANPVVVFQVSALSKGERSQYTLHAMRSLKNSPQAHKIASPPKWTADKDPRQSLDDDQIERINRLMSEAKLYLAGKRAQGDLFVSGGSIGTGDSGDGQAAELPSPDPAALSQASYDGLLSMLGANPNRDDAKRTIGFYAECLERLQVWKQEGTASLSVLTAILSRIRSEWLAWLEYGVPVTKALSKRCADLSVSFGTLLGAWQEAANGEVEA